MPSTEILFMLALLVAALVAFARELLPIEVTAMSLLAILLATGTVSMEQAIAGFSNKAVVAIGGLFVLGHALTKTGVLEVAAETLSRRLRHRPWMAVTLLLATVGTLSGFLNNTAVVAIFIPLAIDLCRRIGIAPSKVLIPLSYASIFGGTLTLIGTSTNLLVSAVAEDLGEPAFSMFELTPLGAILLVFGLGYTLVAARRLLPDRETAGLTQKYQLGAYLTEVQVTPESKLAGISLSDAHLRERYDTTVLAVLRGEERITVNLAHLRLSPGDVLIVEGGVENILRLRGDLDVALLPDVELDDEELGSGGHVMVEGIVMPDGSLVGRTVAELDFRQHFGGFVLAVRRVGATLREKIARIPLQSADSLLMLVRRDRLGELRRSEEMVIVSELDVKLEREPLWWLVFLVLPGAVLLAALGILDIAGGALLGSVALLAAGVIKPQEAYRAIHWPVLFLIAAFIPVGQAMISTGAAQYLASGLLAAGDLVSGELAPYVVLSLVYIATSLLTQMISNNAAAIIVAPLAITLGPALGVDSRPFLVAVTFAASAEFMTPMGYQTNMMVYGPGGYRFFDYTKFGAPLNLAFWLGSTLLIPWIWGF